MASERDPLKSLVAAIRAMHRWLKANKTPGFLIGGVAVAALGRPRVTRDVDALVLLAESEWPSFLARGALFDIHSRIADPVRFARESRMLLLQHAPSKIDIDVSLGGLVFEQEAVARAQPQVLGRMKLPFPTPEDFIVMKAVANRDHDWADIEGVLDVHQEVDESRIRRWVGEFAAVLESPEILERLEAMLAARKKQKIVRRKK